MKKKYLSRENPLEAISKALLIEAEEKADDECMDENCRSKKKT